MRDNIYLVDTEGVHRSDDEVRSKRQRQAWLEAQYMHKMLAESIDKERAKQNKVVEYHKGRKAKRNRAG